MCPGERAGYDSGGTWHAGSFWKKLWRGVTHPGSSSQHITITFPVEQKLLDKRYSFRYRHRIVTGGARQMDLILNGTTIKANFVPPFGVNTFDLPSELLTGGNNTLKLQASGSKDGIYSCFSYHLVEFEAPAAGTMVILK